jgi:bifunctional N-acetylglucosamine-1-phosphate-uridyltransferase/glucosamine-1-phosphate-acetyltransferase GlmU-like protein
MSDLIIPNNIGAVILAAGRGTRLGCVDKPKVMLEIGGKPIVSYIIETFLKGGFNREQIVLVVGFCAEKIKEYFGDKVLYAMQTEQRGTADAAYVGMKELPKKIKHVLVLGGDDSAFYTFQTLQSLIENHLKSDCKLTLLSAEIQNPGGAGRIARTEKGIEIIEKEYLTEEQKRIKEISTGTFVFDREWFESIFPKMPQLRKLGEYGLPTALATAREQAVKYQVIKLENSDEWRGVNTPEELEEANNRKGSCLANLLK